jgi:PAS domain S-box-containing protein
VNKIPEKRDDPQKQIDSYKIERSLLSEAYFQLKETAKKLAMSEETLRKSHEETKRVLRFNEALLSSVPTPIFYKDTECRYLGCNRAFSEIMGVTPEQLKGKTVFELWPSEHAKMYDEKDKELMRNPVRQIYEFKIKDKDGMERPVIYCKDVFRDENDQVAGIVGAFLDISEQKKAEQSLERANRALHLLSGTNQALIHITDEAALLDNICKVVVETGGYRLMWIGFAEQNEAKTVRPVAQAGFGADYLKTAMISWADNERGRGPTGAAIRTGQTQVARNILEDPKMTPWREAAVEHGYKSSIALPLKSNEQTFGALNLYAGEINAFSDKEIAILEELADDLAFGISTLRLRKKVEERTREVDQLKNKFIQIVSHQLYTPLNVIRWNLEAILDRERGEVSPSQIETLRGAYAANMEIISRIGDLLKAMDIEEGRMTLNADTADLGDLFRSVSEEKLQPCRLKNITYEIIPPEKPIPPIKADAEKIREVVARLIDNAITYTNDGGKITVKFFVEGDHLRFEIADTGMGIPAFETARIFERFHRGWNASQMKPDASGLSLYISKHYISEHHGRIGFTSEEKKGSTFWFELPIS